MVSVCWRVKWQDEDRISWRCLREWGKCSMAWWEVLDRSSLGSHDAIKPTVFNCSVPGALFPCAVKAKDRHRRNLISTRGIIWYPHLSLIHWPRQLFCASTNPGFFLHRLTIAKVEICCPSFASKYLGRDARSANEAKAVRCRACRPWSAGEIAWNRYLHVIGTPLQFQALEPSACRGYLADSTRNADQGSWCTARGPGYVSYFF